MKARFTITALGALLIFCAGYAALFIAPDEATMHAIQRIFYFHVASWNAMFCAFFVAFCSSVAYLVTGKRKWDALGVSGVEVGVICCTIGLITGPLWAKPVWGIWWVWDPRLTTTFILWLLYISYLMLRAYVASPGRTESLAAVVGALGFITSIVDYMAIRWWRTQHPQRVIGGGPGSGLEPRMWATVFVTWGALLCLF